ncbi:MAG: ATP-binding protein, partial [Thermacetogeniaceae bacterium]
MAFLGEEQAFKVMINFNPWWSTGAIPKEMNKPVKRVAFYSVEKALMHPKLRRIVFLSGARRVGKTTLMYQVIGELLGRGVPPKRILYLSYDHPVLKFFDIGQLVELFSNNVAGNGEDELYLFFDEIQYAGNWDTWLKVLYDQNPRYRIMVTGSALPLSTRGMESGVGRWVTVKIPTLSFYEYIELIGAAERPLLPSGIKPTKLCHLDKSALASVMLQLSGL